MPEIHHRDAVIASEVMIALVGQHCSFAFKKALLALRERKKDYRRSDRDMMEGPVIRPF